MTAAARIQCCIPFCRRTRGGRKGDPLRDGSEWICGEHWRLVPRRQRQAYGRYAREWRRFGAWEPAAARLWRWIKRRATERAMGVG